MEILIVWVLTVIVAGIFVLSYVGEPRNLRNGFLLLSAVILLVAALILTGGMVERVTVAVIGTPLLIVGGLGYVVLVVLLIGNSVIVVVRERLSLAALLPAALAVVMVAVPIVALVALAASGIRPGIVLPTVALFLLLMFVYFGFVFVAFLLFCLLYRARTGRASSAAVLILGSRIIDGRVPPLLAARIERGIAVFEQRKHDDLPPAVLICSGAQGPDESRSEAAAMAEYALARGVPADSVIEEDRARTTEQNLIYGAESARQHRPDEELLVATNDFHVFRTAVLTRRLGIRARVVAAPTARYFVPSAFLREFIAVLRDYVWLHALALAGIMVLIVLLLVESYAQR